MTNPAGAPYRAYTRSTRRPSSRRADWRQIGRAAADGLPPALSKGFCDGVGAASRHLVVGEPQLVERCSVIDRTRERARAAVGDPIALEVDPGELGDASGARARQARKHDEVVILDRRV